MRLLFARLRGRLRLARGRCPACASERSEGCRVCRGHDGPFPAEPECLARWSARFAADLAAVAAAPRAPAAEVRRGG